MSDTTELAEIKAQEQQEQELESVVATYDETVVAEETGEEQRVLVGPSDAKHLKQILEAAIMAASEPLSVNNLQNIFADVVENKPDTQAIKDALEELTADYEDRGIELKEVATGYRFQARSELAPWITKIWQEKPPRYSRAVLETLAIIAYRQPATRAEIEEIRGVAVSSNIVKILIERGWVHEVGHKDAPGRPALLATTQSFLDYFNLNKLTDLPSLAELKDFEALEDKAEQQLELDLAVSEETANAQAASESTEENTQATEFLTDDLALEEAGETVSENKEEDFTAEEEEAQLAGSVLLEDNQLEDEEDEQVEFVFAQSHDEEDARYVLATEEE